MSARRLLPLIAFFAFFVCPAAAQNTTTYTYTGNAFSPALCQPFYSIWPPGSFVCSNSNVTAAVTFQGLPAGYNGTYSCSVINPTPCPTMVIPSMVNPSNPVTISLIKIVMAGAGASATNADVKYISASFLFQNGAIVLWNLQLTTGAVGGNFPCNTAPGTRDFQTFNLTSQSAFDDALNGLTSPPSCGEVALSPGTWALTSGGTSPLQIATTSLPNATSSQAYSTTLMASGGSGSGYTWSRSSGALPAGFSLNSTGVLSSTGTPSAPAGTYGFTVQVTDSAGNTATQPLTLLVVTPPLQITTTSLPPACGSYSTTLTATGGTGGYTWSIVSPPAGFALNPATGVLSSAGIPPVPANSYSFTVQVTDSAGNTATQPLTLVIPVNFNILPYGGAPASGDGRPTTMNASFTPTDANGAVMTLDAAAVACGFVGFDWMQTITVDPGGVYSYSTCTANGGTVDQKTSNCTVSIPPPAPPFLDPPQGGYTFEYVAWYNQWLSQPGYNVPHFSDTRGFYYSPEDIATGCAIAHVASAGDCSKPPTLTGCDKRIMSDSNTLNFFDRPGRTSYPPKGPRFIALQTQFVGLLCPSGISCADPQPSGPLYKWTWETNFTPSCSGPGTGGIFGIFPPPSFNPIPSSPGRGGGGITITSINDLPQTPPSVSCSATPNSLWPPDGKPVLVTLSGTVTPGTQAIPTSGTTYAVIDEYALVQPSGGFTTDAGGSYSFTVPLIAARDGNNLNGRTYTINVIATDQIGNVGSCSAVVTVPHDQGIMAP